MPTFDYQTLFRRAPVGMAMSRERVVLDVNEEAARIFGHACGAIIGQSFEMLYPSQGDFERMGARIAPINNVRGSYSDERIMKRANGELFWCHVTGRAFDRDRPLGEGIWTFEDLSAHRPMAVELTPRERDVAAQLIEGKSSKQIGKQLDISPRTVEIYRARLMKKYGANTAIELVRRLMGH
ncbi:LuxR C-terminal-related transcriptional regulator [Ralstonia sp. 24A2]|uniref:LuxR C-terminal-related transcriptional regulator n=1 Tax=Ralstonia sp. 24A2 TaxID=3447364 RepID=UPI003F6A31AF